MYWSKPKDIGTVPLNFTNTVMKYNESLPAIDGTILMESSDTVPWLLNGPFQKAVAIGRVVINPLT